MIKNGVFNIFNVINQEPKFLILCIVPIFTSLILNQIWRETFPFSSLYIFFFCEIPMGINKRWKKKLDCVKTFTTLYLVHQISTTNPESLNPDFSRNELLYSYIYTSEKRKQQTRFSMRKKNQNSYIND